MARFCLYPALPDQATANDLLARLTWFFAAADVEEIVLSLAEGVSLDAFVCPESFDPAITELFQILRPRLTACSTEEKMFSSGPWAAVFLWQDSPEKKEYLKEQLGTVRIWSVDKRKTRMEGSFWIEAHRALQNEDDAAAHAQAQLKRCREEFTGIDRAIVLASGPSVAAYREFDYDGCLPVICNSIVADEELLEHVQPRVLCFADPLFHFGPSRYAAEFRRAMLATFRRYRPWVVVPLKYYRLLLEHTPELEDRLIGLPHQHRSQYNLDLLADPELKVTANILSYLLLPVAATFARRVDLLGCDGRPLAESQYFWSFNPRTQFSPELMENIKRVHPSFFDIDYNDYYTEHCEVLEKVVRAAEAKGIEVRSLAASHIPVLQRRSPPPSKAALSQELAISKKPLLISLNPDLKGHFGHFLHLDRKLREAMEPLGWDFLTLASRDLDLQGETIDWPVLPFFSLPIFHSSKTRTDNSLYREWALGFRREIAALAEALSAQPDREICIFFYMTTVRSLAEIIDVLAGLPPVPVRWVLNLSGIYVRGWPLSDIYRDERFRIMRFMAQRAPELERAFGMRIITDDVKLAGMLRQEPPALPVLPMFGVTNLTPEPIRQAAEGQPLTVVYPTNVQSLKGFILLPEAFAKLAKESPGRFRFRVRSHIPIGREHDMLAECLKSMPSEVEQLPGVLKGSDYTDLLHSADIIVLPYRAEAFYVRTSAQLIDAITLGKPVVVIRETWLGDIVEQYGCGVTFPDGSSEALARAIQEVADDMPRFREGLRRAREEWLPRNSTEACAHFLCEQAKASPLTITEGKGRELATEIQERCRRSNQKRHKVLRFLDKWWTRFRVSRINV